MELDKQQVAACLRIAPRTLNQWVKDGFFPAPVYIGRRAFWAAAVVEAWIAARLAGAAGTTGVQGM